MKEYLVCLKAAQAGAKIIQKYYGKTFSIRHKGKTNLVTEVDERSQEAIVRVIRKHFRNDGLLAEEGDLSKLKDDDRRWIIDPLDGTTNFAHGYPRFCVSVAFEKKGVLQCGVIIDPLLKETFHAKRRNGAFCNRRRISVSRLKDLKQALLVTGFPYDLYNKAYNNLPYFSRFLFRAQAIRRDGSAALNLAYVAAGRFDGFWEPGLNPWDVAAGVLLIQEAGGKVSDFRGRPYRITEHALCTANPLLHPLLLKEIRNT